MSTIKQALKSGYSLPTNYKNLSYKDKKQVITLINTTFKTSLINLKSLLS